MVLRMFWYICCDFSGSHKSKPSIQVIIGISDCIPVCQYKPDHIARPLEGRVRQISRTCKQVIEMSSQVITLTNQVLSLYLMSRCFKKDIKVVFKFYNSHKRQKPFSKIFWQQNFDLE